MSVSASENCIYRVSSVRVRKKDPLYGYFDRLSALANNLANAVRFRQRQILTAAGKAPAALSGNERAVLEELRAALPRMGDRYAMPGEGVFHPGYGYLDAWLKASGNPDYFAEGLPRQTAQQVIRTAVREMKAFREAVKAYRADPSAFTGAPGLPGYRRKGGRCMAVLTNQDAVLRDGSLKLPLTKERLSLGNYAPEGRLKEVRVLPDNGTYLVSLVFEAAAAAVPLNGAPSRIAAIDFGVSNLMAVTNNCGLPCLLFKGGALKAANQLYNKKISAIVSEQTLRTGEKFVPTPEYLGLTVRRSDYVKDFLHKAAKRLVSWCVENRIDTLTAGVNRFWKQEVQIGRKNNQEFVQIPHAQLRGMLRYLCEAAGVRYVEQEESYTSKASFRGRDPIPVYGKEDRAPSFSGRRGARGTQRLYRDACGVVNADLNGSANILRKAFPGAFDAMPEPDFGQAIVVRHPDRENTEANRRRQLSSRGGQSLAKQKRMRRKAACTRNPYGIGLCG